MKVLKEAFCGYRFDPVTFFDFDRFGNEAEDYVLAIGFIKFNCLKGLENERVVLLCFEEPNGFFAPDSFLCHNHLHIVDKVFTICPYTEEWSNKKFPGQKWQTSFFPFNEELIPPQTEKEYDLIYAGGTNDGVGEIINTMPHFKQCLIQFQKGPHVTHPGVDYKEKLRLFSRSRIAVVHNMLFPYPSYVQEIQSQTDLLQEHEAFSQVAKGKAIMPQLKSRLFEAAFCRTLILCRRDPWNLVERFFEPDKEFVYYDEGQLKPTVEKILANYDDYLPIIEAAYNRAISNYTTRHYFDKNLKGLWR